MDTLEWLRKHLDAEGSDLLREMVGTFAERLMAAEVDVLCNAGSGEITPERTNSRNGYRSRQLDTMVGSIELAIPSCVRAASTRTGCSSRGGGPSEHWSRWWRSVTCTVCRHAGWTSWCRPWGSLTWCSSSATRWSGAELHFAVDPSMVEDSSASRCDMSGLLPPVPRTSAVPLAVSPSGAAGSRDISHT